MRLRMLPALSTVLAGCLSAQDEGGSPSLEQGKERSYELAADQSQEHYVLLRAGQYARFNITQHTVNVAVAVFDPAGKQLFALDNSSDRGNRRCRVDRRCTPGKYRLRVTASEAHAPSRPLRDHARRREPWKRTATGLASRPRAKSRWRQPRTGEARVKRCCRLSAILSLPDCIGTPPRIRARKRGRCMRSRSSTSNSETGRRRSRTPPRPCRSRELHAMTSCSAGSSIASAKYITISATRRQRSTITCKRCRYCEPRAIAPERLRPSTTWVWRISGRARNAKLWSCLMNRCEFFARSRTAGRSLRWPAISA